MDDFKAAYYIATKNNNTDQKKQVTSKPRRTGDWVPVELAWKKMGISKYQWYTRHQKLIKHKSYGGSTWVYAPSILEFLLQVQLSRGTAPFFIEIRILTNAGMFISYSNVTLGGKILELKTPESVLSGVLSLLDTKLFGCPTRART